MALSATILLEAPLRRPHYQLEISPHLPPDPLLAITNVPFGHTRHLLGDLLICWEYPPMSLPNTSLRNGPEREIGAGGTRRRRRRLNQVGPTVSGLTFEVYHIDQMIE